MLLLAGMGHLAAPFYWDSVLGYMHQALWLAENQFNLVRLLTEMPGYRSGGPAIYFESQIPTVLALGLKVLGGGSVFRVTFHLLQFVLAGCLVGRMFRIARDQFGPNLPVYWAVGFLLLHPLMLSQSRVVNAEILVGVLTLAMVMDGLKGRPVRAVFWLILGRLVKDTILLPAIALGVVLILYSRGRWRKILPGVVLLSSYYWPTILYRVLNRPGELSGDSALHFDLLGSPAAWFGRLPLLVNNAPLIYYPLILLLLGGGGWICFRIFRQRKPVPPFWAFVWLCHAAMLGVGFVSTVFPVRYHVMILPFTAIAFARLVQCLPNSRRQIGGGAVMAALLFDMTGLGSRMFGQAHLANNGAILERSLEFEADLALNQHLARLLSTQYAGQPIATWWPLTHQLWRPEFGYVEEPLPVVAVGRPAMEWDGLPSLEEWLKTHPGKSQDLLWVYSPSLFSLHGTYVHGQDELVEQVVVGDRLAILFRRRLELPSPPPDPPMASPVPPPGSAP